jgi:polysaccharide biosynthesis/export protein
MSRIALVLLLSAIVYCQTRPVDRVSELDGANLPAQKIGPNDLLSISVYGSPELTRTIRVGADGAIRLPMLKRRIQAEGLMPGELEVVIAESLRSEEILVDPLVTVTLAQYYSRPISVAGAVRSPVTFQAIGNVTLLDALTRAGGLSPEAGPDILVSRLQPDEGGKQVALTQRIPVKSLLEAADAELNLKLVGGEEIRVPEVGKVFVVGNVKKPGAFPVQDVTDTTVLKMLALAEGLAPFAGKEAYIYRREAGAAAKNEIPIEIRKILERKVPDVPLQANDILYIPDAKGRRATMAVIERLVGFGSATASGVLIWGAGR